MKLGQKIAFHGIRLGLRLTSFVAPALAARWALDLFTRPMERVLVPLSPFFQQATLISLSLDGERIQGYRWEHALGPRAMILHGFESSATNFEAYAKGLYERGFEVLAFDAPANGRSMGSQITPDRYARMIQKVMDKYGPVDRFIAHSFGALALGLALEQVTTTETQRVAIIAGMTETCTAADQFFDKLSLPERLRKAFDKKVEQTAGHSLDWYSLNRALANVQATICWFHDKEDLDTPLTDLDPLRYTSHRPIQFLITEGLGHRDIYKDAAVQQQVIQFLA